MSDPTDGIVWCTNDQPHKPHRRDNRWRDYDYCSGRPVPPTVSELTVRVQTARIDAAAARLLGRARASDTEKGLAKDLRTVLDALTVAQGKAMLSQPNPTGEPDHRVSIYPVAGYPEDVRLTIVAECTSCGRMGTWSDTAEGNRQARAFTDLHKTWAASRIDPSRIHDVTPPKERS